jgi:hypothetical protein
MNRARQDAITTEIMEIVGGAEALGQDVKGIEALPPHLVHLIHAHEFHEHDQRAS